MTQNYTLRPDSTLMRGLLILLLALCSMTAAFARTERVTMREGETKTLYLPASFTSAYPYCKGTAWLSYGVSYVQVTSHTNFSVTIKAVKAFSSPIIVRCDYYYYRLVGGKYVYGGTTFYDFEVTVEASQPTSVSLSRTSVTMAPGNTVGLVATVTPSNVSTTYSWTTSDYGVATVNNVGTVTAKSPGTAVITCTTGNGLQASCTVYVTDPQPTAVSLPSAFTLSVGEESRLSPVLTPSSASTSYTWKSSDPTVVTVDSSGRIRGIAGGTADITVRTANGLSATCRVTVKDSRPTGVSLRQTLTLDVDEEATLVPTLTPADAVTTYSWRSDDEAVVTVSYRGVVKAISPGTATVTVKTANNLEADCRITVKEPVVKEMTDWSGVYTVESRHVSDRPTRTYEDDFRLVIEKLGDDYVITSMFDDDLTADNDGGLRLVDNGDSTAYVDVSKHKILRHSDTRSPLYALYLWDETTGEFTDSWPFRKNPDGSLSIGNFYVAAFTWNTSKEVWDNGYLEALYYNLTGRTATTGLQTAESDEPMLRVVQGSILFDRPTAVSVYTIGGQRVFSGVTQRVDGLEKGVYIVKTDTTSRKIIIR